MDSGHFVISLDFELMWGVRDNRTKEDYGPNILGAKFAINQMLDVFEKNSIKATFAIVGFLFHKDKLNLLESIPNLKPTYFEKKLSPYEDLQNLIGNDENDDPYYFGYSLFQKIKSKNIHEIATHTYCHYYCLEGGQTIEQFEEDLKWAISVAKLNDIEIKSIVFPRNQYNIEYLNICKRLGIDSFRGNEKSRIYESCNGEGQTLIGRALRLIDSYVNITGYHCYNLEMMKASSPFNIPSSRFLRPYSDKLAFIDFLKFLRIKNAMTYAAKNNLMYHLWWHPHNFGSNCIENIKFLEKILKHYKFLNEKYKFQSITMEELSNKLNMN
jgi:hypothetical protein